MSNEKLQIYRDTLNLIKQYYGVSDICASYMHHRSFRSKRRDDKYLEWTCKLQNAVVKADKCLGLDWTRVQFGSEEDEFSRHGIIIAEMPDTIFKWTVEDPIECKTNNTDDLDDTWTTVTRKKQKKKPAYNLLARSGLYI